MLEIGQVSKSVSEIAAGAEIQQEDINQQENRNNIGTILLEPRPPLPFHFSASILL